MMKKGKMKTARVTAVLIASIICLVWACTANNLPRVWTITPWACLVLDNLVDWLDQILE